MIEVRVEAVCDWCGTRKLVDPNGAYAEVADWEAVVGPLEDRPNSLAEAITELGAEPDLQTLCPECSEHVTWSDDLTLAAIDDTGEALRGARRGGQG